MEKSPAKLEINSYLYEAGVQFAKARSRRGVKSCLEAIERVSRWASCHHPGRFADGELENLALEIGRKLKCGGNHGAFRPPARKRSAGRTLHLATRVFGVGGHTRVLAKWVESDIDSDHIVVMTDQREKVPDFFQQIISRSGNHCFCLPVNESIERRSAAVRGISQACERVILHTHPHDSIPVVAFAKKDGPPVAMFNHAHYSFNLCSTVSDIIVNTLEYFRKISEQYRFARATSVLPLGTGLWAADNSTIDKGIARQKLSLSESPVVIMSMAVEHYFRPMEGYNFFHTARDILNRLPDAYLMVVGVKKDSELVPEDLRSNPRLLLMGYVENPILLYHASDIFLESFPMPSLGALSEAVAYGEAYPVPVYGPGEGILRVQRPFVSFPYRPTDEKAYVEYVVSLAGKREEIRAEALRMRIKLEEFDRLFENRLRSLNTLVDSLKHSPGEIPVAKKVESADCRILAELDQSDIGEKINALFPFIQSASRHMNAVLRGYQTWGNAMQSMVTRMERGLSRRAGRFLQH